MNEKLKEIKKQNSKFFKALKNATNGIAYSIKTQKHLRAQFFIGVLAIVLGFLLKISIIEWIGLVITIFFVLFAETFNTAIECVVDMYTEEYNEKAKIAKDVGAGAVVIASLNALVVAALIFFDKILNIIL